MKLLGIDSGPIDQYWEVGDVPEKDWPFLVLKRKHFLEGRIGHGFRQLIKFVYDSTLFWKPLGYASHLDLLERGYGITLKDIDAALRWLDRHRQFTGLIPDDPAESVIGYAEVRQFLDEHRGQPGERPPLGDAATQAAERGPAVNYATLSRGQLIRKESGVLRILRNLRRKAQKNLVEAWAMGHVKLPGEYEGDLKVFLAKAMRSPPGNLKVGNVVNPKLEANLAAIRAALAAKTPQGGSQ